MKPAEQPKPKWTEKRSRDFEINCHYTTLKSLRDSGRDPVNLVVATCGFDEGAVSYAKRFWHELFQDLPELRKLFPEYAERFEPYAEAVRVAEP